MTNLDDFSEILGPKDQKPSVVILRNDPIWQPDTCLIESCKIGVIKRSILQTESGSSVSKWLGAYGPDQKASVGILRNDPIWSPDTCFIESCKIGMVGRSILQIESGSSVSKWPIWVVFTNLEAYGPKSVSRNITEWPHVKARQMFDIIL